MLQAVLQKSLSNLRLEDLRIAFHNLLEVELVYWILGKVIALDTPIEHRPQVSHECILDGGFLMLQKLVQVSNRDV